MYDVGGWRRKLHQQHDNYNLFAYLLHMIACHHRLCAVSCFSSIIKLSNYEHHITCSAPLSSSLECHQPPQNYSSALTSVDFYFAFLLVAVFPNKGVSACVVEGWILWKYEASLSSCCWRSSINSEFSSLSRLHRRFEVVYRFPSAVPLFASASWPICWF